MPDITINGSDGQFSAYLAIPEGGSGSGVLVIQEIFGVNRDMRDHCNRFAGEGYFALCPDLFWRLEPGVQLTDRSDAEWKRAAELYQALDVDKAVGDLQVSLAHLRNIEGCSGRAGSIGFCLGGLLAYLMAARTDADCNAGYYGVGIESRLDEARNIGKPTILHIAEEDRFVSRDAQQQIRDGLEENANVTIYSYPGMEHAFARHKGTHFDAEAARIANQRTAALFAANL